MACLAFEFYPFSEDHPIINEEFCMKLSISVMKDIIQIIKLPAYKAFLNQLAIEKVKNTKRVNVVLETLNKCTPSEK